MCAYLDFLTAPHILGPLPPKGREYFGLSGVSRHIKRSLLTQDSQGSPKACNRYTLAQKRCHASECRVLYQLLLLVITWGFPGGSGVEDLPAMQEIYTEGMGSIPGLGRYPGEENSNPLHYFCLENSMNRGAWQTVHRVAKSGTRLGD